SPKPIACPATPNINHSLNSLPISQPSQSRNPPNLAILPISFPPFQPRNPAPSSQTSHSPANSQLPRLSHSSLSLVVNESPPNLVSYSRAPNFPALTRSLPPCTRQSCLSSPVKLPLKVQEIPFCWNARSNRAEVTKRLREISVRIFLFCEAKPS
ncbi:MAG: hypothetical protein ACI87A_003039, partial [Planctomycetota bacterium]